MKDGSLNRGGGGSLSSGPDKSLPLRTWSLREVRVHVQSCNVPGIVSLKSPAAQRATAREADAERCTIEAAAEFRTVGFALRVLLCVWFAHFFWSRCWHARHEISTQRYAVAPEVCQNPRCDTYFWRARHGHR